MGRGLVGNPPARPSLSRWETSLPEDRSDPYEARPQTPDAQDRNGQIDPSFLITHKIGLEDGPDAYKTLHEKADGCIKVVMNP